MEKARLLEELKQKFDEIKRELGFKSSFEEIEEIFYIENSVLKDGFVSDRLSRHICRQMEDLFARWNNYIHNLLFPNPANMIAMSESKLFNDSERKEIYSLVSESMGFMTINTLVGINNDKKGEAKLIDDWVNFWKNEFKPGIEKIMKKIKDNWEKE